MWAPRQVCVCVLSNLSACDCEHEHVSHLVCEKRDLCVCLQLWTLKTVAGGAMHGRGCTPSVLGTCLQASCIWAHVWTLCFTGVCMDTSVMAPCI